MLSVESHAQTIMMTKCFERRGKEYVFEDTMSYTTEEPQEGRLANWIHRSKGRRH